MIAGYTKGTGGRLSTFGALVMAAFNKTGKLIHIGNVGTGFSDEDLSRMMKLLNRLHSSTKTIPGDVKAPTPIKWVKPRLVAEVGYMKMTTDRKLRFPRFIRLRLDGNPADCTIESSTE